MARASGPPPKDWEEIDRIFTQALDLAPERWPAFLDEACEGDPEVRSRVADLLRLSLTLDDFLKEPRLEVEGELAADLADRLGDRDAPFPTEARIGPYRIIDTLGRGGAGTVYLAERAEGAQKPPVALKVLRRGLDTDDLLERFTVERQILATLDHPDVARLLDAGATEDGRPYLVMEHVDGVPITEHCGARGLSVEERLGLFVRVARAVQHAHASLVVHRDLKPANVLVAKDGTLKLLDFGIAKLLDPDALAGKGPQTRTGTRLLTPGYASPEQRRGEPVTPASDIYQLGLLLYELLTGVPAYEAAGKERKEAEEGDEGGEEKRRAYRDQWGDGDRPLPRIPAPSKVARRTGETSPGKGTGGDADPATGSPTRHRFHHPAPAAPGPGSHRHDGPGGGAGGPLPHGGGIGGGRGVGAEGPEAPGGSPSPHGHLGPKAGPEAWDPAPEGGRGGPGPGRRGRYPGCGQRDVAGPGRRGVACDWRQDPVRSTPTPLGGERGVRQPSGERGNRV
jgi:hypothetical protein